MVKLTESIIFARTKCNNIDSVKKLNVWGCDIHDISIVAQMPNIEVLSLSVNCVESLEPLAHCYNLRELYMRKNEVSDVGQLDFLASLHKLKVLWLDDNPVAEDPEYRVRVLRALPQLQTFDNRTVNQEEVNFALSTSAGPSQSQQQLSSSTPGMTSSGNVMTSSVMSNSHYIPSTTNPQMTSSVILGRSFDESSYYDMQAQQQQQQQMYQSVNSHHPGVQIVEGHTTPTHGGSHPHSVPPMCEVAIYNPTLPPNAMTQSYHQGYTQGYAQQQQQHQGYGHGAIPENHAMDESWHEFGEEESGTLPPMPRFGMRRSPRSRMNRSRSVSPGRMREGRMDSIMSAVCSLMDELDMESLRHVIDEAHERIKKLR